MPGDLGPLRHGADLVHRQRQAMIDQAGYRDAPIPEIIRQMCLIFRRAGIECAVGAKHWRDIGLGEFRRQCVRSGEKMLGFAGEILDLAQCAREPGLFVQVITARQHRRGQTGDGAAEEFAAVSHGRVP